MLSGKNILVTGGSLGIGFAIAEACLRSGARVMIVAREKKALDEARDSLAKVDGAATVAAVTADVSDPASVEDVFETFTSSFGRLDGVVNSAGIYGPIGPITDVDPQEWLKAIHVNLFGSFLVARAACSRMRTSGGGRIVLLSGGGAATPFPNYTAYATSKVAVVRLTETIAIEMAPFGIEVNAIAPGFVATRLHEQTLAAGASAAGQAFLETTKKQLAGGAVPPSVAANASVLLLSDAAKGITGKFVAAPYDGWKDWPAHVSELQASDIFTLRRILPKERGMDWQ